MPAGRKLPNTGEKNKLPAGLCRSPCRSTDAYASMHDSSEDDTDRSTETRTSRKRDRWRSFTFMHQCGNIYGLQTPFHSSEDILVDCSLSHLQPTRCVSQRRGGVLEVGSFLIFPRRSRQSLELFSSTKAPPHHTALPTDHQPRVQQRTADGSLQGSLNEKSTKRAERNHRRERSRLQNTMYAASEP